MQGPLVCLTSEIVKRLINRDTSVSLDLGISEDEVIYDDGNVMFPSGGSVQLSKLRQVTVRGNVVFVLVGSEPVPVEARNNHYLKLVPTADAPALEIDGVRMHRTKDFSPSEDAERKVAALNVQEGRLLEIGTGLGYTAQAAARKGATCVVSLEVDPKVLWIARVNPWSRGLFMEHAISIILADSSRLVSSLPEGFFDYVLHDPPTIARAGDLYSEEFYGQLFSVLKAGGRLFHYVGTPGATSRGLNIVEGVAGRLRRVGFSHVKTDDRNKGVYCEKPVRFQRRMSCPGV